MSPHPVGSRYCARDPADNITGYVDSHRTVSCPRGTRYKYLPEGSVCISQAPACPVANLTPITDTIALQHEKGQFAGSPDTENLTPQTSTGMACIIQKAAAEKVTARITSGFRPPAYQAHIREVWDKWHLLKSNNADECKTIKNNVRSHWVKHGLVRRPVQSSNHSTGKAVDIAGIPADSADQMAKDYIMFRPEPQNDPVHFQLR